MVLMVQVQFSPCSCLLQSDWSQHGPGASAAVRSWQGAPGLLQPQAAHVMLPQPCPGP